MNSYVKPEMEICVIEEEDVLLSSGVTLPTDEEFPDAPAEP